MAQSQKVNTAQFDDLVLKNDKKVLVDFYADWCGPCKALAPVLDEVATEFEDNTIVVKVNVDEDPELAQKYGIRGMPTMLFIKNGEVKSTLVGNQPKQEIISNLNKLA